MFIFTALATEFICTPYSDICKSNILNIFLMISQEWEVPEVGVA